MTQFLLFFSAALSVIALLAFIALYVVAIWKSWRANPQPNPPNPNIVYVATALAGLVGGFVASAFGQTLPDPPTSASEFVGRSAMYVGHFVTASPRRQPPDSAKPSGREWIGMAYISAYFGVGIAAGVTWLFAPSAPDLVKNLAMIVMGLIVAIAGTYMHTP